MMREFRNGFAPLDGTEGLVRQAHWSDMFFNYVPAEQVWDDGPLLAEAAKQFVEVNPDCPYTVDALCKDFIERI